MVSHMLLGHEWEFTFKDVEYEWEKNLGRRTLIPFLFFPSLIFKF